MASTLCNNSSAADIVAIIIAALSLVVSIISLIFVIYQIKKNDKDRFEQMVSEALSPCSAFLESIVDYRSEGKFPLRWDELEQAQKELYERFYALQVHGYVNRRYALTHFASINPDSSDYKAVDLKAICLSSNLLRVLFEYLEFIKRHKGKSITGSNDEILMRLHCIIRDYVKWSGKVAIKLLYHKYSPKNPIIDYENALYNELIQINKRFQRISFFKEKQ